MDVLEKNSGTILNLVQAAQEKQMAANRAAKRAEDIKSPKKPVFERNRPLMPGSVENAPIEIVVYSNFQCHFCKNGAELIKQLVTKYEGQTKLIFKHLTSDQTGYSEALIFEAAGMQSPTLAWELNEFMFEHQTELSKDLTLLNDELIRRGIEPKPFYETLNNETIMGYIESDNKEIREYQINGTPTFLINGVKVEGIVPLDELIQVVEETIKRAS